MRAEVMVALFAVAAEVAALRSAVTDCEYVAAGLRARLHVLRPPHTSMGHVPEEGASGSLGAVAPAADGTGFVCCPH